MNESYDDILKRNMDIFLKAEEARANNQRERVFDWEKAARLIKEGSVERASAGLSEDWSWTGGCIFDDGAPMPQKDTYVYLASIWATPVIVIDDEQIECWKYVEETPGWDAHTYWPEAALAVLRGQ